MWRYKIHPSDILLEYLEICSIVVAIVLTFIIFKLPLNRGGLIPYIMTYSSCNLALIGFIFSLLLNMKNGRIYNRMMKLFPDQFRKIYKLVFRITLSTSFCILSSLLILAIRNWTQVLKYFLGYILVAFFFYMFAGTLLVFKVLIGLLIKDTKTNDDEDI